MRYTETQPTTDKVASIDPAMMHGTVVYTLLLGIFFIVFGQRVKKRWIIFWGATMVLASAAYFVAIMLF